MCYRIIFVVSLLCAMNGAWAQTAADKAAADTLFEEGRQLIGKGALAEACAKFEASLHKVIQLGTQLALATCYEKRGMTASAWAMFRAAAATAGKASDKRLPFAEERALALEGKLSRLSVTIDPASRVDGLQVKRDGVTVSPAEVGSLVPVDPGPHIIESSAPGHAPWSITVSISTAPGVVDVPVPPLAKAPAVAAQAEMAIEKSVDSDPALPADLDRARRKRRLIAYGIGGGGVAVVGVSLIFGALASSRWSAAQDHCDNRRCDPTGLDLAGSARTMGNVSTGTFVVGAGAVAAGAILWLTMPSAEHAPPGSRAALRVVPSLGAAQVGLSIAGGF